MRDDMSVTDLVTRARIGDQQAWDALVERYTPLVWSVCRQYWLGITDAQDVGQTVWLRLVDQLGNLRDPAALAGWLATTTRRECIRRLHQQVRRCPERTRPPRPGTDRQTRAVPVHPAARPPWPRQQRRECVRQGWPSCVTPTDAQWYTTAGDDRRL